MPQVHREAQVRVQQAVAGLFAGGVPAARWQYRAGHDRNLIEGTVEQGGTISDRLLLCCALPDFAWQTMLREPGKGRQHVRGVRPASLRKPELRHSKRERE